jgi:signal transduction histidine kinase
MGDLDLVQGMIDAGAAGYVLKGGTPEELLRSLTAVAEGKGVLDDTVTRDVFNEMSRLYAEERARADELDEVNRMKTEFISIVSHELQTPLAIIKAGLHLLHHRSDAVDEDTKEVFFDSVEKETNKLIRVVDQVLTVTAIQKGDVKESAGEVVLGDIAHAAVARFGDDPDKDRIKLEVHDDETAVVGDRAQLVKVTTALIDNALRFSSGDVTLRVSADESWGSLTVSDEGPGMDPAIRDRVLEQPFVQGDSSNTREHGGLGLSLYVANGVLKAFGGKLAIDDDYQGGSFQVKLPIRLYVGSRAKVKFG